MTAFKRTAFRCSGCGCNTAYAYSARRNKNGQTLRKRRCAHCDHVMTTVEMDVASRAAPGHVVLPRNEWLDLVVRINELQNRHA